ncbi:hypothetical protein NCU16876 [Neurospora crassa OR74A]|uniref:Uncharacterized protein n=1 Tax=Neurospora crassa (strain ATCC 24698 / 74-OR23-1A / CBS 708.71 / DSM 1257 / FGSC 987) TaxID=367110 RepID=V5IQK9_NEUCR|nr:hypothetical protein NCU16876 [Neurospora crassa OR74A]ESA43056.1 hypothetical protein NCU16876 [Neurospora crassa OR74A]|eukprot:XP_011394435.1 hypothetical protein NCU16876 [Neurospora crassa OR74A]
MVSAATGSDRTVPPPTSFPSVANILVDGDKSVTLKVTTVTCISAKNSTTVVPILTLSIVVVEEIAQESVAVLTVPVSPASETTSVHTPSPCLESRTGKQKDAELFRVQKAR